ncbi:LysM-like peptidoglycan-binding domain-containing protein [Enterobacteriaceae bacterium LUAb1]
MVLTALLWPVPQSAVPHPSPVPVISDNKPSLLQAYIIDNPQVSQVQWYSYRIDAGQTLAQLFREHNLSVSVILSGWFVEKAAISRSVISVQAR